MSYDLVVWEGEGPSSDQHAAQVHEVMDRDYFGENADAPPTPLIVKYVQTLLQRWPDLEDDDDTVWSTGPLIEEASGPIIHFSIVWSYAEEASAFAVQAAKQLGLVCFDPQTETLRA